jgi:hypothetical protein
MNRYRCLNGFQLLQESIGHRDKVLVRPSTCAIIVQGRTGWPGHVRQGNRSL